MTEPLATIVVVPRERFSVARRSLAAILDNTAGPYRMVYVDGGSPAPLARELRREARRHGFELVRSDRYLTPNGARNLGLERVTTRYAVFIDNDVVPAAGWLENLVRCAEETGAWVVGPLYFIGEPEREEIHMAGGDARIEEDATGRRFVEAHRHVGKHPAEVREHLVRGRCEQVEFHCMLVRTDVLGPGRALGPLDEALSCIAEHTDVCLTVAARGGQVWFEPSAVVTYITSGGLRWYDYPYFLLRWSEGWTASSLEHFRAKWRLPEDDRATLTLLGFVREHRHFIALKPVLEALVRVFDRPIGGWLGARVAGLETRVNRWFLPAGHQPRAAPMTTHPSPTARAARPWR